MTTLDEFRLALFVVVTIGLAAISWRTLPSIRSHGFFRFIAWEAIAALIIWNLPFWFTDSLSAKQVVSWIVLCASLYVLWQGVSRLRTARQSSSRTEGELFAFEKTSELVTSGIYHRIRHPLYASLLYLAWGAFLKSVSLTSTILVVVASASLVATAKAEEKECMKYFGEQYRSYAKGTKMFIPFVF